MTSKDFTVKSGHCTAKRPDFAVKSGDCNVEETGGHFDLKDFTVKSGDCAVKRPEVTVTSADLTVKRRGCTPGGASLAEGRVSGTLNQVGSFVVRSEALKGSRLGGYEIVRHIGHGATASVYEGRHLGLDKPVAVKILHEHLAGDEQVQSRFVREEGRSPPASATRTRWT